MKDLAKKIREARLRKLPVLLALAAALVVPTAIQAYAQEDTTEPETVPVVIDQETEPVEETPPIIEPTTEEPPVTEEEQVIEDVVDENLTNDETTEDPVDEAETPAEALQRYIDFAMAEHPDVEIAEVKFVWKNGIKSAKIIFEDGWKVYIGVSDGSTLSVADAGNRIHRCQRRMKSLKPYYNWHQNFDSYYEWWMAQQSHDDDTPEQETDETEDPQTQSIQDTNMRNTSARGTQHYTDWTYRR